jgi:hypothetical protein
METSEITPTLPDDAEGALADPSAAQELGGPLVEEDEDGTYHWQEVCASVKQDDIRRIRFLEVFQEQYDIATSVDALVHAPDFLNQYLLNEFDYRLFIHSTGLADDDITANDFGIYERQNLQEDITIGVSVIFELVTKIASKMGISLEEAMASMPGGAAVRIVPKCCALSRWLPGALCTARALKAGLSTGFTEGDPWGSDEAAGKFAEQFSYTWDEIAITTNADEEVVSCCSGTMRVSFVNGTEYVSIVSLVPVNLHPWAPNMELADVPLTKFTDSGPDVLLEIEPDVAELLEEGMILDGHFFELKNGPWFMSSLSAIRTGLGDENDEDDELAELAALEAAEEEEERGRAAGPEQEGEPLA